MKFISDEEWRELQIAESPYVMNEILSRVYNGAIEAALTQLPEVAVAMIKNTGAVKAMSEDYFKRNKEFKDHKDIVTSVLQEVEVSNPAWDYEKILKESEGKIKEKIGAVSNIEQLSLDMPENPNRNANGVI